jgi:hypothetical protein
LISQPGNPALPSEVLSSENLSQKDTVLENSTLSKLPTGARLVIFEYALEIKLKSSRVQRSGILRITMSFFANQHENFMVENSTARNWDAGWFM